MNQTTPDQSETDLIARAVAGERVALERLLLRHNDRLIAHIGRKIPAEFRGLVDAHDILQLTLIEAFRGIADFRSDRPEALSAWLTTIADHRLLDHLKALRAAKRGGEFRPLAPQPEPAASSIVDLLDLAAVNERTPSRSVARRQAVSAIHVALAGLKDEYRDAVRMRHIEGMPVAEIAEKMNRTERAVHMLCNRGLKKLQEAMGRASQFLSKK